MPTLIFDHSEILAEWAADRIAHVGRAGFGPCTAIGIASGNRSEDVLYAVCIFHDYQERSGTIQVSLAARSPRWATPGVLRALLHYAFQQLGVRKLWMAIPSDNPRALRFNRGIGMREEAALRHHFGWQRHAIILSMLRAEYEQSRWYWSGKEKGRGKERAEGACCA